ncbi:putative basic proline-rich protein-like [Iris pallida]|uniref:Basic proline-rich protein-like n=1 Tax=Iris pallida TaxID=29817 RepID=A0AAX6EB35_IRIPA|nr:putative basic proline-rich protein-like [Iris pallida]
MMGRSRSGRKRSVTSDLGPGRFGSWLARPCDAQSLQLRNDAGRGRWRLIGGTSQLRAVAARWW